MEELPYFQFFPAEWIMGDITMCSLAAQGLFINILSFYWTRDCSLDEASLKHRFSQASSELDELLKHGILKLKSDKKTIEIKFLDVQYKRLKAKRKKLQKAGEKGGRSKKPGLSQALSDAKATPKHIEKKRKDKIRKEKNTSRKSEKFSPPSLENIKNEFQSKGYTEKEGGELAQKFMSFYQSKGWMIGKSKMVCWRAAVNTWILNHQEKKKKLPPGNPTGEVEYASDI